MATLCQKDYAGDGIYILQCLACDSVLGTTVHVSDHYKNPTVDPKIAVIGNSISWPIRYCWFCGEKFRTIVWK